MTSVIASDIAALPLQDRIRLVEDIWDSIAAAPETLAVPEWHKKVLAERLSAHRDKPEPGAPWSEVRRRIQR